MNIKKIAASFLAAVMLTVSAAVSVLASAVTVTDGSTFDADTGLMYSPLEDGTLLVSVPNWAATSGDVVIPETFGEGEDVKNVTQIRYEMVFSQGMMTSLHIPKTVVALNLDGGYSSSYDSSLQSITVDEDNPVFSSVDGVLFNKDKTEIIKYPPQKVLDEYVIPSTVTTIGSMCFAGNQLQSVVIPDSVKEIGWFFLWECHAITKINIPSSVESIGGNFILGSTVSEITVDSANTNYCAIDKVLFSADKKTLIVFPPKNEIEKYIIPDGTEIITSDAFYGSGIKEIVIPESVIQMSGALSNCRNLISAEVPNKVTDISYAFSGCESLESVTLPLSIEKIGFSSFGGCNSLKKIYYAGTQEDWDKIEIGNYNEPLQNATIYFSDGTTGGAEVPDVTDTVVQEPEVTENEDGTKDFTPGVKKNITTTDADIETMKAITANAPADAFDDDVVLNVSHDTFSGSGNSFAVDVSFINSETNEKVQPKAGTKVTVKIPVPESLKNSESIFVYHVNDDGKAEKVEAKTETINGVKYVVFEADKFSVYALTDTAVPDTTPEQPGTPSTPDTSTPSVPDTSTPSTPETSAPSTSAPAASSTVGSASFPNATSAGSTNSDPASSESAGGDSGFSESANSTPASSSASAPTASENNPGTGIAISFVPLIAAAGAVIAVKKLKK